MYCDIGPQISKGETCSFDIDARDGEIGVACRHADREQKMEFVVIAQVGDERGTSVYVKQ